MRSNTTVKIDDIKSNVNNTTKDEMKPNSNFAKKFDWDGFDILFILILVFFGVFSRFWVIQFPRYTVFDESK